MSIVLFTCGCQIDITPQFNIITLAIDEDGFINCPKHFGYRRYGWRSLTRKSYAIADPESGTSYVYYPDFGMTLQESEILFWSQNGLEITKVDRSYEILNTLLMNETDSEDGPE